MVKATTLITCSETLEGVRTADSAAVGAAVEALGAAIDHLHQSLERYCHQA
jgi:two-component system sensor histidine kinase EvgS